MRLLVIEDNSRLLELIAEDLKAAGYVIDTARTVADAWSFLGMVEYDLLVLDLSCRMARVATCCANCGAPVSPCPCWSRRRGSRCISASRRSERRGR